VAIVAESGLGKTRLVQEFYRVLAASEDGSRAYWPADLATRDDNLQLNPDPAACDNTRPVPFLWWGLRLPDPGARNQAIAGSLASSLHSLTPHPRSRSVSMRMRPRGRWRRARGSGHASPAPRRTAWDAAGARRARERASSDTIFEQRLVLDREAASTVQTPAAWRDVLTSEFWLADIAEQREAVDDAEARFTNALALARDLRPAHSRAARAAGAEEGRRCGGGRLRS
jgi:hypothetical protein